MIFNDCLSLGRYPKIWKHEYVTPVPKSSELKTLSSLRKISCTSRFSQIFEGFLKTWIMEDIWKNIDPSQFCGEKGTGIEHMIVKLLDRIHSLLDENPDKSAVLAVGIDWHSAFDRVDPTTKCVSKFIKL